MKYTQKICKLITDGWEFDRNQPSSPETSHIETVPLPKCIEQCYRHCIESGRNESNDSINYLYKWFNSASQKFTQVIEFEHVDNNCNFFDKWFYDANNNCNFFDKCFYDANKGFKHLFELDHKETTGDNFFDKWFYDSNACITNWLNSPRNKPPVFNTPEDLTNFLTYEYTLVFLLIFAVLSYPFIADYLSHNINLWIDFLDYCPFVRSYKEFYFGPRYLLDAELVQSGIWHSSEWWINEYGTGIMWVRHLGFEAPSFFTAELVNYLPGDIKNKDFFAFHFHRLFFEAFNWADFIVDYSITFII